MARKRDRFQGYCPFADDDCIFDIIDDSDCLDCCIYKDCDDPSSAELWYAMGANNTHKEVTK